jgi:hypothetical protein
MCCADWWGIFQGDKVTVKRERKVYDKAGQRFDTPEEVSNSCRTTNNFLYFSFDMTAMLKDSPRLLTEGSKSYFLREFVGRDSHQRNGANLVRLRLFEFVFGAVTELIHRLAVEISCIYIYMVGSSPGA